MKKWFQEHKFVLILFLIWQAVLWTVSCIAPRIIPQRPGYIGVIPWANMDGIHYLRIAREGYFQFGEAFFPLYPLTIRYMTLVTHLPTEWIGIGISAVSFLIGFILLYDIVKFRSVEDAKWTTALLISFPTAFFFSSVYTEGMFFMLIMATVFFTRCKQFLLAGVFGALAGATRIIGVFLIVIVAWEYLKSKSKGINWMGILGICLVPLGLLFYMLFLYRTTGDFLRFFHVQSAFGANRSGSGLILLPQVLWRYLKILFTAVGQPTWESYVITIAEFCFTILAYALLYYGTRMKQQASYLWYALFAITLPTLTGTLSSMPRYLLTVFPVFIILGQLRNKTLKISLVIIFSLLQVIGTMVYLRGWFVA